MQLKSCLIEINMRKKKRNEKFFRKINGSLIFRLLLIEIGFLVLPLFIFMGVMYFKESKLDLKDDHFALKLILHAKEEVLNEMIEGHDHLLSWIYQLQLDAFSLKKMEISESIFHLIWKNGRYVCDLSTKSEILGKDFTKLVAFHVQQASDLLAFPDQKKCFFLKSFSDGKEMWVKEISIEELLNRLDLDRDFFSPSIISLVIKENKVFVSTRPSWEGKSILTSLDEKQRFIKESTPIKKSNLILLVASPEKEVFIHIFSIFAKMGLLILLILFIGGGMTFYLTLRMGKPLKQLCFQMKRIGKGDFKAKYQKDRMGFEINLIGNILNEMVRSLVDFIDRIKKEKSAKEAYEKELMIGHQVQTSIIPKEFPSFPGLDVGIQFAPAKEVSGDFYDFMIDEKEGNKRLFFSIADAADKGIYACFYSLTIRSMLRSFGRVYTDLKEVIEKTNRLFCLDTGDRGVFVTAWLAYFNEKNRQLLFSNCGHFPAYLLHSNGKVDKLTTKGRAFGIEPFEHVFTCSIYLEEGDTLLLFTDGVIEAYDQKMKMFGEARLIEKFKQKKEKSAQKIAKELFDDVKRFSKGQEQHDDLTLFVLKVC